MVVSYRFADQFSLLHFSVGTIAYFWNIPFFIALIIHAIFEWIENTKFGMEIIKNWIINPGLFKWPGGKYQADSSINILGDNVFFAIGWITAYILDILSDKYNWYEKKL